MAARDDPPPVWPPPGEDFYCSDPWGEVQRTRQHVEEEREILRRVRTEHVPFANALMAEYTAYAPSDPNYPTAEEWRSVEEVYNAVQRELNTVKANVRAAILEAARVEALVREYLNAMEARRVRLGWSGRGMDARVIGHAHGPGCRDPPPHLSGEGLGDLVKAAGAAALTLGHKYIGLIEDNHDTVARVGEVAKAGLDAFHAGHAATQAGMEWLTQTPTLPQKEADMHLSSGGYDVIVAEDVSNDVAIATTKSARALQAAGLTTYGGVVSFLMHASSVGLVEAGGDLADATIGAHVQEYVEVYTNKTFPRTQDGVRDWSTMLTAFFTTWVLKGILKDGTVVNSIARISVAAGVSMGTLMVGMPPGVTQFLAPSLVQIFQVGFAAGNQIGMLTGMIDPDITEAMGILSEVLTNNNFFLMYVGGLAMLKTMEVAMNRESLFSSTPLVAEDEPPLEAGVRRVAHVVRPLLFPVAKKAAFHLIINYPFASATGVHDVMRAAARAVVQAHHASKTFLRK